MNRRELITFLGAAAAAFPAHWPRAARAQQAEPARRIGLLMGAAADDPEPSARIKALQTELDRLGWTIGRNLRMDMRSGAGEGNRLRTDAAELVALAPDLLFAVGNSATLALRQATRRIPIVFTQVIDPVGVGIATSLARPGGQATGFTTFELGSSARLLALLKQVAPDAKRAAIVRERGDAGALRQVGSIQSVAETYGVELSQIEMGDMSEVERAAAAFASEPQGGLIVLSESTMARREQLIALAARLRLPAVYADRFYAASGGLISYAPDTIDVHRRAAGYVDRILRGANPAELPVQLPSKYDLVINLKAAKALGLEVPRPLLDRAAEVIE